MDLQTFQNLPTKEVAKLVRAAGPKVCVFPINGTRRWFMLEYPLQTEDPDTAYLDAMTECYIQKFQMVFDHGVDTLLSPIFGPDIMERGEDYTKTAVGGLERLALHPDFLNFYQSSEVRVRFYGDYQKYFKPTPYAYISDLFAKTTAQTQTNQQHRLFIGLYANDATETVAEISANFYQQYGHVPNRQQIIESYYGEFVEPVDFFIGFDRPTAYDMPLVATGNEDLYFTVAPSPYLDVSSLRAILYDHLYARRVDEGSYTDITPTQWRQMANFYTHNRHAVLGLGTRSTNSHFWYPSPQIYSPVPLENILDEKMIIAKSRNGKGQIFNAPVVSKVNGLAS